jgi:hypothetical protein
MHGLTGSQTQENWRTDELLRVGDDLRAQRDANARRSNPDETRHGLRGWVGRHLVVVGRSVACEPTRTRPCPDLPNGGQTRAA